MLWSPDPPNYPEKDLAEEASNEVMDYFDEDDVSSDESGEELPLPQQYMYELLPQDNVIGLENEGGQVTTNHMESNEQLEFSSGTEEPSSYQTNKERIDIEVNDEEVRAAMQNITLPPTAIPSWAGSVPESQWKSFLLSRMSNLQSNFQK